MISYFNLDKKNLIFTVRFHHLTYSNTQIHIFSFCRSIGFRIEQTSHVEKIGKKNGSVYQTNPLNQFGLPVSRAMPPSRRLEFVGRSSSDLETEYISVCLVVENQPYSKPITPVSRHSSVKSNQFREDHSFPLPMFPDPDQFKIRPAKPSTAQPCPLQHSRVSHRFQPY